MPETGEFEASVPAPRNSQAGHLVVSIHKGNIWIRLAIPHAFYLVDDTSEMVRIIDAFLSDEVFFAIVTFRESGSEQHSFDEILRFILIQRLERFR